MATITKPDWADKKYESVFNNKTIGNEFRAFVNQLDPEWAQTEVNWLGKNTPQLSVSGSYDNVFINRAFEKYGQLYAKWKGLSYEDRLKEFPGVDVGEKPLSLQKKHIPSYIYDDLKSQEENLDLEKEHNEKYADDIKFNKTIEEADKNIATYKSDEYIKNNNITDLHVDEGELNTRLDDELEHHVMYNDAFYQYGYTLTGNDPDYKYVDADRVYNLGAGVDLFPVERKEGQAAKFTIVKDLNGENHIFKLDEPGQVQAAAKMYYNSSLSMPDNMVVPYHESDAKRHEVVGSETIFTGISLQTGYSTKAIANLENEFIEAKKVLAKRQLKKEGKEITEENIEGLLWTFNDSDSNVLDLVKQMSLSRNRGLLIQDEAETYVKNLDGNWLFKSEGQEEKKILVDNQLGILEDFQAKRLAETKNLVP